MKELELCYSIDDDHILIPSLLSETEPEYTFDKEKSLHFVFDYNEHLPPQITSWLLVKSRHDTDISWRNGVVLKNTEFATEALITFDRFDKKAYVHVNGSRKRDYFATIWKNFNEIHKSFANLDYEEKIPLPEHEGHYATYKDLIGHEAKGWAMYRSGALRKEFSVKELLDGVEDEKTRREKNPELQEKHEKEQIALTVNVNQTQHQQQSRNNSLYKKIIWFLLYSFVSIKIFVKK